MTSPFQSFSLQQEFNFKGKRLHSSWTPCHVECWCTCCLLSQKNPAFRLIMQTLSLFYSVMNTLMSSNTQPSKSVFMLAAYTAAILLHIETICNTTLLMAHWIFCKSSLLQETWHAKSSCFHILENIGTYTAFLFFLF